MRNTYLRTIRQSSVCDLNKQKLKLGYITQMFLRGKTRGKQTFNSSRRKPATGFMIGARKIYTRKY